MSYNITPELENYAHEVRQKYGVPESVTLAQAIYESSLGKSNLAKNNNNWFGIKSPSGWAKYDSVHDGFLAYGKLLSNERYTKYTKDAKTSAEYINGVIKGGYCDDDGYTTNIISIINSNNLEKYNTENGGAGAGNTTMDSTESSSGIIGNITDSVTGSVKEIGAKITSGIFVIIVFIMAVICLGFSFGGVIKK